MSRELLELAARAMPFALMPCSCKIQPCRSDNGRHWRPDINSGDCAEMCATLLIGTTWWNHKVDCNPMDYADYSGAAKIMTRNWESELFSNHNNDRAAAWRMAALRVAAEIGRAM